MSRRDDVPDELLEYLKELAVDPVRAMTRVDLQMRGIESDRLIAWVDTLRARPLPSTYRIAAPDPLSATENSAGLREAVAGRLRQQGIADSGVERAVSQLVSDLEAMKAKKEEGNDQLLLDLDDSPSDDSVRILDSSALAPLEARWHEVFPLDKPFSTHMQPFGDDDPWDAPEPWLAFLEREAEAGDSVDILDDIATAIELGSRGAEWTDNTVLMPILDRGWHILTDAMKSAPSGTQLPWIVAENRAALRLAARRAYALLRQERAVDAIGAMELLLAWNPNDNHGFRALQVNHHLEHGAFDRALEVCDRYPGDVHVEITYGRCLALFAQGRRDEATAALGEALRLNEYVPAALTRKRVAAPKTALQGISIGGKDQAYEYRLEARAIWSTVPGALDWLKKESRSARGSGRAAVQR